MKSTIYCRMENMGQHAFRFSVPWEGECPDIESVKITGRFEEEPITRHFKETRGIAQGDVKAVFVEDGMLNVDVEPVIVRYSKLTLNVGDKKYEKQDFDEILTEGEEVFEYCEEGEVMYRLYTPQATEPRPMILFLHGGGNGGTASGPNKRDNRKHILTDYGPINFAQDYPDVYVMAPMAVEEEFDPVKMAKFLKNMSFANGGPGTAWTRKYLGLVCDIIRRMIKEGKVDPNRIYVTGMSMGGGGTIRAMSVGQDLFAAAAPVCPTMDPETFDILRTLKAPVWVSTAYVDHTVYRHKYLVDAVMQLKDEGNKDAHLTLYSPEELAKYDIAIEDIPYEVLFRENHASWVPTYHNEHGIMTWLLNQRKK